MVSVIIPNINGIRYLDSCLNSLKNQVFKDFEIIVVDNGSVDGSAAFIRQNFPNVKVIDTGKPVGFAAAVNIGIKESKGEYIALLNNDTVADSNWLGRLYDALEVNKNINFCASKMMRLREGRVIDSAGDFVGRDGRAYNYGGSQKDSEEFNVQREVFGACAGAAIYRKELFDKIGLFDEDFYIFFEDSDLSFRAQLMRMRCLYVPGAVVYHHRSGWAGDLGYNSVYYSSANSINLIVKNLPLSIIFKNIFYIVMGQFKQSLGLTSTGRYRALSKGRFRAIMQLNKMLKKRREIQSRRVVGNYDISKMLVDEDRKPGLRKVIWYLLGFIRYPCAFLSVIIILFVIVIIVCHDLLSYAFKITR